MSVELFIVTIEEPDSIVSGLSVFSLKTIFGILNISKLFSVKEIAIISHIAAGIHGSYLGNNKNIDPIKLIQVTKNILNV